MRFDLLPSNSKHFLSGLVMLCKSVASEVPPSTPIDDDLLEDLPLPTLESLFLDSLQLFLVESHPLWIKHWLAHAFSRDIIFLAAG